jgi:hypothetical protein
LSSARSLPGALAERLHVLFRSVTSGWWCSGVRHGQRSRHIAVRLLLERSKERSKIIRWKISVDHFNRPVWTDPELRLHPLRHARLAQDYVYHHSVLWAFSCHIVRSNSGSIGNRALSPIVQPLSGPQAAFPLRAGASLQFLGWHPLPTNVLRHFHQTLCESSQRKTPGHAQV